MAKSGKVTKPNQGRRNERERNRVNQLNENLEILRNHVPTAKATKKLNKAQTLREAAKYIEHLQAMLNANYADAQGGQFSSSCDQQNMVHPGNFISSSDFDIYFPYQNSHQVPVSMDHSPTSSHSSIHMGSAQMSPAGHQMGSQAMSPISEPSMYHHYQMQHYQVMHHSP